MIKLYLNGSVRSKELQVIVHHSEEFISEGMFPISFVIYPKEKYFQNFIENESVGKITSENISRLIDKYLKIYEDYSKRLSMNHIIFKESNRFDMNTFYINKSFIEVQDIINCSIIYSKFISGNSFTLYFYKNTPLYENDNLLNLDLINNNNENYLMENYIRERENYILDYEDIVKLFILEKWIQQEKYKQNPKYDFRDYLIEDDNKKGHFVFNDTDIKLIEKKIIQDINLKTVLKRLYGKEKGNYLLNILKEDSFKYWKL